MTTRTKPYRSALLWAIAGAALFLGVGAAMPVWTVHSPDDQRVLWKTADPRDAEIVLAGSWVKGPLWDVAAARLDGRRWLRGVGKPVPWLRSDDAFLLIPAQLLVAGAVAGLFGYFACLAVQRRKGGGP